MIIIKMIVLRQTVSICMAISAIIILSSLEIVAEGDAEVEEGEVQGSGDSGKDETATDLNTPVCSVHDLDTSKTCIAIKFPWKEDSVYFCTEKANLTFTTRCGESTSTAYCPNNFGIHDLRISTPWDCCPHVSKPNACEDITCASEPFNRTCVSSKKQEECCPTYFCEKGDATMCKMQRSKSVCINPPKNKINCTTFIDPYGCCHKFQCASEGKDGECPIDNKKTNDGTFVDKIVDGASKILHPDVVKMGKKMVGYKTPVEEACTGDYTCPGTKKCCPSITNFPRFRANHNVSKGKGKNKNGGQTRIIAVNGVCMEPINLKNKDKEDTVPEDEPETGSGSHSHTSGEE